MVQRILKGKHATPRHTTDRYTETVRYETPAPPGLFFLLTPFPHRESSARKAHRAVGEHERVGDM